MVSGPFPEVFLMTFGMKKGGKITKILSGIMSGNENGDFSRNVLKCRRQHEIRCSHMSEIGPESGKNGDGTASETEARSGRDFA